MGPARAVSAAPTSLPGGVLLHVLCLPQQVPWTGQPGRTTGLERLGFYGDTWAALRAGLRAALRAGLRAVLRTGPLRVGSLGGLGRATRRAAGPPRARPRAAPHAGPTTAPPRRWTFGPNGRTTPIHTNGHRGPAPLESTTGFMYRTLGLRSGVGIGHAGVYYTPLDRTTRAAAFACTC